MLRHAWLVNSDKSDNVSSFVYHFWAFWCDLGNSKTKLQNPKKDLRIYRTFKMFRPIDYNALGREFRPGEPLSAEIRRRIVVLYWSGVGPRAISRTVRVTHGEVCRIIRPYQTNGTYSPFSQGGRRNPSRLSDNVLESIELFKLMKNSMFGREIRERLLNDGVCDGGNLPTLSTVNKRIKNKLHVIPVNIR